MLNYSKASWAGTAKVKGSGPIFVLGYLYCRGNEKSLEYCRKFASNQRCDHSNDVGVTCRNLTEGEK
jgi:hypothetical protein